MKKALFVLMLVRSFCMPCNGQTINQHTSTKSLFSENMLLQHVKTLSSDSFEGRRTGSRGAIKAEKYIINQFIFHGVIPFIKNFRQQFSVKSEGKHFKGVNLLGLIKGSIYPNKYIVISAHYDHEGIEKGIIYNGADDNASGIGALFSFAEYFKNNPPKHSVILAAFDAEELDLAGSEYFVNSAVVFNKNFIVNLNMDMISRNDKNELFIVGTSHNKDLKNIISSYEAFGNIKLVKGHDGYDGLENWTYSSDHANFHKKGIPFLYFGVEEHKDYHEPTDDYENIQPKFYVEAVKSIISISNKIDESGI